MPAGAPRHVCLVPFPEVAAVVESWLEHSVDARLLAITDALVVRFPFREA